jgi:predicted nucleic acid-binding protein
VTVVVDASVVVAALVDPDRVGRWAESVLVSGPLAAPALMPAEVANVLRRAVLAGEVPAEVASLAHDDLLALRAVLFPYRPLAHRVWELRAVVTVYDGWYVALSESLGAPLATLDRRLSRAPGLACEVLTGP